MLQQPFAIQKFLITLSALNSSIVHTLWKFTRQPIAATSDQPTLYGIPTLQ
jgi:hypothetical protein